VPVVNFTHDEVEAFRKELIRTYNTLREFADSHHLKLLNGSPRKLPTMTVGGSPEAQNLVNEWNGFVDGLTLEADTLTKLLLQFLKDLKKVIEHMGEAGALADASVADFAKELSKSVGQYGAFGDASLDPGDPDS
jgi:hypothetical protein